MLVPPIIACTLLRSDWLYALFQMVFFNDSRILFWFVKNNCRILLWYVKITKNHKS